MDSVEEDTLLKAKAFKICREYLGGPWEVISLKDLRFDAVRGGFSNKLYHCSLPEEFSDNCKVDYKNVPKEALLRIYGPMQENINSLLQELTTFILLSERNLGPKLHGLFSGGRLEEYIPSRSLKWSDLCTLSTSIATELANFHTLHLPIRKKPVFQIHIYKMLEFLEAKAEQNLTDLSYHIISSGEVRREVEWVLKQIDKANSPVLFCHNDLHKDNILLMDFLKDDGRNIMIIDFEMAGFNYRGFDLANYFNERCFNYNAQDLQLGYEIDLQKYPSESEQIEFVTPYLNQLHKHGFSFQTDFQTELTKILKEVSFFKLASHLYWAIACFEVDPISSTNFSFRDYANTRWELYKEHKKEFLVKEC